MRHAQIVTFGLEARLVDRLRLWAEGRGLWLRPTQHLKPCLNLLAKSTASVLILRLGRDLEKELYLLERISTWFPAIASIAVAPDDNPPLANLAWDLGAACVLLPLPSLAELEESLAPWLPPTGNESAGR